MLESERLRREVSDKLSELEEIVADGGPHTHVVYSVKKGARSLAELIARLCEAERDESS